MLKNKRSFFQLKTIFVKTFSGFKLKFSSFTREHCRNRQKISEAIQFCPKFIDVCPNHDLISCQKLTQHVTDFCPKCY